MIMLATHYPITTSQTRWLAGRAPQRHPTVQLEGYVDQCAKMKIKVPEERPEERPEESQPYHHLHAFQPQASLIYQRETYIPRTLLLQRRIVQAIQHTHNSSNLHAVVSSRDVVAYRSNC
jgi:hypothetical protein